MNTFQENAFKFNVNFKVVHTSIFGKQNSFLQKVTLIIEWYIIDYTMVICVYSDLDYYWTKSFCIESSNMTNEQVFSLIKETETRHFLDDFVKKTHSAIKCDGKTQAVDVKIDNFISVRYQLKNIKS